MTNFTWVVTTLLTQTIENEQNYVVTAYYDVTGTDGIYTSTLSNVAQFSTDSVSTFIPYEDLTNDIVTTWIKNGLGPDGVENIYACIQGQIDSQINPPVSPENTPLPPNFYN